MIAITITTIIVILGIFFSFRLIYPNKYDDIVQKYSTEYGVDSNLVKSMIWVESKFKPKAISNKGALGLMQLLPSTAEWLNSFLDNHGNDCGDLYAPDTNIKLGVFYLSKLLKQFDSIKLAVVAYNAGPGNVSAWLRNPNYTQDSQLIFIPFKETQNYLNKVLKVRLIYNKIY
ncbi:MAG: lytic transglycosylase domain-containing protein [Firmicutes bacterium]|nr:lytic transglycosylase domain-containing protein [Bacillota bacterium]MCL1953166.1 lytic transglycosylase domain-containing protein [Bacillota bacterium]